MKQPVFALFAVGLLSAGPLSAQVVCPAGFPSPSPVPSFAADDIPPTDVDIITYTGALAKARANHNFSFVQITLNDQRVWFAPDASPGLYRCFYNRRVRDNEFSPWRWEYSVSPAVIEFQRPSSSGPAAVLYSDTPKYRDAASGSSYRFLMYQVVQPGGCDGVVAGFLYYALSNDGICWTPPRRVIRYGGPSFPCFPGYTDTVPVEAMSAVDGGDRLYLIGVEGNVDDLAPRPDERTDPGDPNSTTYRRWTIMDRTLTAAGFASYDNPGFVNLLSPNAELSAAGVVLPAARWGGWLNGGRYQPYAYFMNMQIAWDAGRGDLYIGRGYPYPYDRGSLSDAGTGMWDPPTSGDTPNSAQVASRLLTGPNGPSLVEGCLSSPYTLPNRIQVYKMHIGTLANLAMVTSGVWTLVSDLGGSVGYGFSHPWSDTSPLTFYQTNGGRDFGAVSFLRDRNGFLVRDSAGAAFMFGADTFMQTKSIGPCRITGMERETLLAIP